VKIVGFTIIKNAVSNDYPIVEAITSILPVVDEMVVLIGDCTDDTQGLILSINSPKIKIHHSVWNAALRKGGEALADETNKAFALVDPKADWAFYIQGDEVVHEKYHASILEACHKHVKNKKVQGLLFNYLHFYGTYDYVGDSRTWYDHEVRIIRNDKNIKAYRDAQGFRMGNTKLLVKKANAFIYHYGWVKTPAQMMKKIKNVSVLWNNDQQIANTLQADDFDFSDFDSLQIFKDTHPAVMQERIKKQNLKVDIDINRKKFSFKDRVLYWFEKKTGIRPFDFKNYKLLKNE
jgi:hypothetical protein